MSSRLDQNAKVLRVSELIAPDLMLRAVAEAFFDRIEQNRERTIVLDFSGVKSVSRSFAHQYHMRKKASKKRVVEANVSPGVALMLEVASSARVAPKLVLPRVSRASLLTVA